MSTTSNSTINHCLSRPARRANKQRRARLAAVERIPLLGARLRDRAISSQTTLAASGRLYWLLLGSLSSGLRVFAAPSGAEAQFNRHDIPINMCNRQVMRDKVAHFWAAVLHFGIHLAVSRRGRQDRSGCRSAIEPSRAPGAVCRWAQPASNRALAILSGGGGEV